MACPGKCLFSRDYVWPDDSEALKALVIAENGEATS